VPLAPASSMNSPDPSSLDSIGAEDVPRCTECFGYINAYCMFERKNWICCLCGAKNELDSRYSTSQNRATLEELQRGIVDLLEECVEIEDVYDPELKPSERPACVAVLDVSGSEDFVEIGRSGILALMEALPPSTLFGLVTVGASVTAYDMRSPFPHAFSISVGQEGEMSVGLSDTLPADCMLVQLGQYKDNIAAAVESVVSDPASNGSDGKAKKFAYGAAMESILELFEEDAGSSLRVISIIGSMPNFGPGALTPPKQGEDAASVLKLPKGTEHYTALSERVMAMSASVDVFIIAEDPYVGVDALQGLVQCTGGTMVYYAGLDTSALPQDLFKIYSRPFASKALLRLRCSTGFQVARAYGHLAADEQYDNLYHVASCHSESCFAVDLEFDNPSGVNPNLDLPPTMQLAFSYSCIVPVPDSTAYQVQRRLRLETVRVETARQALDIYSSVDTEVLASLLTHKIIRAQATEGLGEARMLLQDWLVILTAKYNEHLLRRRDPAVDVTFAKFPNMMMIPRLVYGMLRGRLLDPVLVSRDERAFVAHLSNSLAPEALAAMLYPRLLTFASTDVNTPMEGVLPLSRESLGQAISGIFILDSYTDLTVHYTKAAKGKFQFPPPPDCPLRDYIQAIKAQRAICPHVLHSAEGEPSEGDFTGRLIEEPSFVNAAAAGKAGKDWQGATAQGFKAFVEMLKEEVKDFVE